VSADRAGDADARLGRADVSSAAFWDDLYRRPRQPWELGGPSPALVDFLDATPPPTGRVAVPGCGRGHDGRYLVTRGYAAVGFDFSPRAVAAARTLARLAKVDVTFEQRDVFDLGAEYAGAFDGVWEYTCYCAIDPARRAEYLAALASILRPGGWLLACFFPIAGAWGGPPFVVDPVETRRLLAAAFDVQRDFAPPRAAPGNEGMEWMVYATRKPDPLAR
jgi:methyl halide transferase